MLGPYPRLRAAASDGSRAPAARLDEAVGLALAIDLDVVDQGIIGVTDIRPATYIGKGKVEEIAGLVKLVPSSSRNAINSRYYRHPATPDTRHSLVESNHIVPVTMW